MLWLFFVVYEVKSLTAVEWEFAVGGDKCEIFRKR